MASIPMLKSIAGNVASVVVPIEVLIWDWVVSISNAEALISTTVLIWPTSREMIPMPWSEPTATSTFGKETRLNPSLLTSSE